MSIKNIQILFLVTIAVLFSACRSSKHIAYLEGAESLSVTQLAQSKQLPVTKIKPNDMLRIVVSGSEDADTYYPFNLMVALPSGDNSIQSTPTLQSYLVNKSGEIDFPVLGKLQVLNLTTTQVANDITEKLRHYLKGDIVVTVRFANFRISVLGEVSNPGGYNIRNERVNVLQALSMAGDLTIYGRRDVVKVLRENSKGEKSITTLNLNDKNLLLSPYFYLQQGDVVYVEPNKAKAKGSDVGAATGIWLSVTSILIGVASLMVTLLKK